MLQVESVSFSYIAEKPTLTEVNFSLKKGEHLCIIGESGCGKSTLLKAIYGLLDLDEGEITWKGEKVLGPAFNLIPGVASMKYLAQEFELMPYISVEENIKKFLSRQHPEESERRSQELLEVIDMKAYAKTDVKLLSGGQKQRVAIAQTLAKEPELLLLDEPFNFIDNFRKNKLRRNLFNYLKQQEITCIFATHDSTDMLGFSDKVLVLQQGKCIVEGMPELLFENPPNFYVASLFNEVNQLDASLFNPNYNGNILVYPHELKVVFKEGIEVEVIQSYYIGTGFFVVSRTFQQHETLYFLHPNSLKKGEKIQLGIAAELIEKRI